MKEPSTGENYEENYVIKILSELFKLNYKHGPLLSTDWKIVSTDMALTTNRESTKENASPKKFILDVKPTEFTLKRTQAIRSMKRNYYLSDKINKFDFTDLKREKKFAYEYRNWGANKKILDIIKKTR